jgi:hypothetical protein
MNEHEQQQRLAVRVGAAAAVAGAVLGTVVNLVHGDLPKDPEAGMTRVAQSSYWGLLHLGIIVAVLLVLVALLGLSQAATGDGAWLLGRGGAVLALPGAAVSITVTAIDGFATKAMADAWAAGGPAAAYGDAVAVETVQNALFHAEAAFFFGLPFLLIGLAAQLPASGLPRRTGWLALTGGAGALIFGASGLTGADLPGLLFNGCAGLITVWALVTGILVWRRTPARAATDVAYAAA